jgi:hypothetical protein
LISLLDSISGFKVLGVLGRDSLQIDRRALDAPIRYQFALPSSRSPLLAQVDILEHHGGVGFGYSRKHPSSP